MTRTQYNLELDVSLTIDDESLESVKNLMEARINEMLGKMEHNDDVRIVLVHHVTVTEEK